MMFEQHREHGGAHSVAGRIRHDHCKVSVCDADHVVEVAADTVPRPIQRVDTEIRKRRRLVRQQRTLDYLGPVQIPFDHVRLTFEHLDQFGQLVARGAQLLVAVLQGLVGCV